VFVGTEAEYALQQKLAQQRSEQVRQGMERLRQMQEAQQQRASRKQTIFGIALVVGVVIGLVRLAYALGRR
jgi:hypothetical protein